MKTRNTVLVVEDSKTIQQLYRNMFTLEQFRVLTADNGMDAIKLLSQEQPDAILLDLMMPVMDGYKVLQVVKTDPKLSKIPVIVFSTKGQPDEVEKALNLGASGYVVKAVTKPKEVVEKIKAVISQAPSEREVVHYQIEIKEDTCDAPRLAQDFGLGSLRCKACQSPLRFDLIPDFSHNTPWFTGKLICSKCSGRT
jgi:CheY-like chemotaxis protein